MSGTEKTKSKILCILFICIYYNMVTVNMFRFKGRARHHRTRTTDGLDSYKSDRARTCTPKANTNELIIY